MAKIECHYGNFRVRWTDENGIRNSRTFDTRLDADYFISRETLRVKEAKKGLSPTLMLNKTFEDLIDYWIKHRSSQKRNPKDDLSIINCHLRPYFG
ncbi:MAG: hypothetical protein K2Q26_05835, partial [Bdellovibrionales bacterium]|nr:hypothetical protein [Bdellovibrionales bacterium]